MPLPVLPGVVRVSVGGPIRGGGNWSNSWHFRRISLDDPSLSEMNALAAGLAAWYSLQVMGRCAPGTTLADMVMTPLDGTSGGITYSQNIQGTDTFETMPPEVAQCLTIRTASRGRRARGRVFLPAFTVSSYDGDGKIMVSVASDILAALTIDLTALGALGWELGVASYGTSTNRLGVTTTWSPFFTPSTTQTMDLRADVQRSRKQ